jgi:hypothetical protein
MPLPLRSSKTYGSVAASERERARKETNMGHTKRNEAQRRAAAEAEPTLHNQAELAKPAQGSSGHSGAALETLNLGHACLKSECWSGPSEISASRRLRGPAWQRSPLHCWRPSQRAKTEFRLDDEEILID